MVDFNALLQGKTADSIVGFQPLPVGTYLVQLNDWEDKVSQKTDSDGQPYAIRTLNFTVVSACEDVDKTKLPENMPRIRHAVFVARMGQVEKQMFEALGLQDVDFVQAFEQAKGRQLYAGVGHRPNPQNADSPFMKINFFKSA